MQKPDNIVYSSHFNPKSLREAKFLCIVGSSGVGKSQAVFLLRSFHNPHLEFPVRYITRPARLDDDPVENVAISEQEFTKLKDEGHIMVSWQKKLDGIGTFWYGIAKPHEDKSVCVISANNAFAREVNLPNSIIIEIWANEKVRQQRIQDRSRLSEQEVQARTKASDTLDSSYVDIQLLNNGDINELATALKFIVQLIPKL